MTPTELKREAEHAKRAEKLQGIKAKEVARRAALSPEKRAAEDKRNKIGGWVLGIFFVLAVFASFQSGSPLASELQYRTTSG